MLNCWTREQCEQYQMMHFGISCATCEQTDDECPWHRRDSQTTEDPQEDMPAQAA
jgi:hypothetical protein